MRQLELVWSFAVRDLVARFRGTWLGFGWILVTPLLLLGVFTLVFNGVFNMKWPQSEWDSPLGFALFTFCGLLVHLLLSEVLSRAPGVILGQPNLVTKVVFPLGVLPLSLVVSAVVQFVMALTVFGLVLWALNGVFWSWLAVPVLVLPFVVMLVGAAFLFAALGLYLRDLGQVMGLFLTMMMFLSPIFYPLAAVPESAAAWLGISPMAVLMETLREVLILGRWPSWTDVGYLWVWALGFLLVGRWVFVKLKRGFADVL